MNKREQKTIHGIKRKGTAGKIATARKRLSFRRAA